jgi:hypothetical protein
MVSHERRSGTWTRSRNKDSGYLHRRYCGLPSPDRRYHHRVPHTATCRLPNDSQFWQMYLPATNAGWGPRQATFRPRAQVLRTVLAFVDCDTQLEAEVDITCLCMKVYHQSIPCLHRQLLANSSRDRCLLQIDVHQPRRLEWPVREAHDTRVDHQCLAAKCDHVSSTATDVDMNSSLAPHLLIVHRD